MEKKIRLHKQIGTKLFLVAFFSIAAAVAVSFYSQYMGNEEILNGILRESTESAIVAIQNTIDSMKEESLELAVSISSNEEFFNSFESLDSEKIRNTAMEIMLNERSGVEFICIADSKGIVIARTHNDEKGDSIAAQRNIIGALGGYSSSYMEVGTTVKFSVISSAPIINENGKIIGTVSTGYQLNNTDIVDEIKEMTSAEISIFIGLDRINTTIIENGNRLIGVTLSPNIAESVFERRETFSDVTTISEERYYAVCAPIIDGARVIGVYSAAKPIEGIRDFQAILTVRIIARVLATAAIAISLNMFISSKTIVKPVLRLSDAARILASGDPNVKLPPSTEDEIGILTDSIRNVSDILSELLNNMSNISLNNKPNNEAGDDFINKCNFDGAYMEVASAINSIVKSYVCHMRDVCDVIKEFDDCDLCKKHVPNHIIDKLSNKIIYIDKELEQLNKDELKARENAERFNNDWRKILQGLNSVMDAFVAPIYEASGVIGKIENGRLDYGEYRGDFEIIKCSLNATQESISSYISEISCTLSEMCKYNLSLHIINQFIHDFTAIRNSINGIIDVLNGSMKYDSVLEESFQKEAYMTKSMLKAINDINDASNNIVCIIRDINDIAFNTNFLTVETNKGQLGVAEQVRKLASLSKESAANTEILIDGSLENVSDGVRAALETSNSLNAIVKRIADLNSYVHNPRA